MNLLVSTDWLAAEMGKSDLSIIDASLFLPAMGRNARAEFEVFERFADLTRGKMAVLISHRFSTVRMADRILVLEQGRISEQGSHAELLTLNRRYAELFHLQAAGYR